MKLLSATPTLALNMAVLRHCPRARHVDASPPHIHRRAHQKVCRRTDRRAQGDQNKVIKT
jgi:hypothetical protein